MREENEVSVLWVELCQKTIQCTYLVRAFGAELEIQTWDFFFFFHLIGQYLWSTYCVIGVMLGMCVDGG